MSEENTTPMPNEIPPAELPTTATAQEGSAAAPGEIVAAPAEAAPIDTSATTSASNAALEEIPVAGEIVVDANVRAALEHVLDGFNNYSLALGFQRIADLLK